MIEQPLDGGIANAGQVVRVGPHVLRPAGPHTASVHAFLRAVRDAGFEGVPAPIGIDGDGRERLAFVDGEVPVVPYPDWSQSDTALASVARLLRGLHDAARRFDPQGLSWDDRLADPAGGTLVCRNDLELSNVVFRDGVAVALIDFEFVSGGATGSAGSSDVVVARRPWNLWVSVGLTSVAGPNAGLVCLADGPTQQRRSTGD